MQCPSTKRPTNLRPGGGDGIDRSCDEVYRPLPPQCGEELLSTIAPRPQGRMRQVGDDGKAGPTGRTVNRLGFRTDPMVHVDWPLRGPTGETVDLVT